MTGDNAKYEFPLHGVLIGFGNAARYAHLPLFKKNAYFVIDAVVEPYSKRAKLAKNLLPDAMIYSDIDQVITNKNFAFVDICTPPCFHAEIALKALKAGLHVFCEKPLATCFEIIPDLIDAAEKHHRVVFTVNNWKHAPIFAKAIGLVRQGQIGRVQSISLGVLRTPNSGGGLSHWRKIAEIAGGGILLDHGWHHLYLALSIIRDVPVSASAKMQYIGGSHLEDEVDLWVRFKNAQAHLHLTWRSSQRQNFGKIKGENGMITINDDHLILHKNGLPPIRYDFPYTLSRSSHHLEWMKPVIEDFRREILDINVRGTNFTEAKWCARLISLAYRSQRENSRFINVDSIPQCV